MDGVCFAGKAVPKDEADNDRHEAEDETAEFLYGKTGFVVEVHQGGDDEEEDEDFVEVGNGDVSCVRAQEVAFVPAH